MPGPVDLLAVPYPQGNDPASLQAWAQALVQKMQGLVQPSVPPGIISPFAGVTVPEGWLPCEGQLLTYEEWPGLFRALGFRFTLDEEEREARSFRLPDARGKAFFALPPPLEGEDPEDLWWPTLDEDDNPVLYGGSWQVLVEKKHLPENMPVKITDPKHKHDYTPIPHNHPVFDPQHTHAVSGSVLFDGGIVNLAGGGIPVRVGTPGSLVIQSAPTGVSVQNAEATGTLDLKETGITAVVEGEAEKLTAMPPFFTGQWIIKT